MEATAGDRLIIDGNAIGQPPRDGEILEVRGQRGRPPYLVRWDDGHTSLVFPGPDARVQSLTKRLVRTR